MGTAGGSEADPGSGTHSRSELTTPHLSHLAQAHNFQQLLKKKNLAFFGRFWQIWPGDRLDGPRRPRRGPASAWRLATGRLRADCAVGSG